ncbi:MAG: sugar transferase [Euryarchaeota archaeon]|nr:sugar transferase [Euryarchaeota archaeon]
MRPIAENRAVPLALLVALDMLAVVAALGIATTFRYSELLAPLWNALGQSVLIGSAWTPTQSVLLTFQIIALPFGLAALNQYRTLAGGLPWWSVERVVAVVTVATLAAMAAIYVTRSGYIPRGVMLLDYLFLITLAVGWRSYWEYRVRSRIERGIGRRNVLIVGSGPQAQQLAEEIVTRPEHGRRVVGFLAPKPVEPFDSMPEAVLARDDVWAPWHTKSASYPEWFEQFRHNKNGGNGQEDISHRISPVAVEATRRQHAHFFMTVGGTAQKDVVKAIDGLCAEEVLISPDLPRDDIAAIVRTCRARGVDAHMMPYHYRELAVEHEPWKLGAFTVIGLYKRPLSQVGWAAKRAVDIVASSIGLILASPLLLLSAIALKIEDPKVKVFYTSSRVGYKGRTFRMVKLTTMVSNAQELEKQLMKENEREGPWFKLPADKDPRLLKVGRVLRKLSINEVPQLWNILVGDMSLVGPRPPLPDEVATYVDYDFRYYRCLDVRPGITGLWQVTARNDPSFDRRIDLDLEYIHNWSIWLDLKIILKTVTVVLTDRED